MFTRTKIFATGLIGLALGATALSAQQAGDAAAPADTSAYSSPFAYAESNMKTKKLEELAAESSASDSRVIGGTVASEGAWPWQVALVVANREVSPGTQFCGGSLVLDTWVLTAAHCLFYFDDQAKKHVTLPPDFIAIVAGTNSLEPGKGDKVPVVATFINPGYDPTGFDNDVALIKLARKPNANYRTIQVPDGTYGDILDQQGVAGVITGWGLIEGGVDPTVMYQSELQIIGRDLCNNVMMEGRARNASQPFNAAADIFNLSEQDADAVWKTLVDNSPRPLTLNMLCSGSFEGGKTACSGDSGGPLVIRQDDGSYVQAGVAGWALMDKDGACIENALFSVYTKVSNYLPWLEQTIGQN